MISKLGWTIHAPLAVADDVPKWVELFNGRDLGIYALEEHFEKRLIEHNRMREGPIVRFGRSHAQVEEPAEPAEPPVDPDGLSWSDDELDTQTYSIELGRLDQPISEGGVEGSVEEPMAITQSRPLVPAAELGDDRLNVAGGGAGVDLERGGVDLGHAAASERAEGGHANGSQGTGEQLLHE